MLHDYCEKDYFQAECPTGKIVVVEEARFGRMEAGTCVTADFGHLDCYRYYQLKILVFQINSPSNVLSRSKTFRIWIHWKHFTTKFEDHITCVAFLYLYWCWNILVKDDCIISHETDPYSKFISTCRDHVIWLLTYQTLPYVCHNISK